MLVLNFHIFKNFLLSQWLQGLRHEVSSPTQTLGSWVWMPLEACMFICVYAVFVLSCVGSHLVMGWYPIQGVRLTVYKKRNWSETKHFTDALCSKWEQQEIWMNSVEFHAYNHITCVFQWCLEACSSIVGWGIMIQAERAQVRFPMRSVDFSIELIIPAALWS
jgi:hypothetical protein